MWSYSKKSAIVYNIIIIKAIYEKTGVDIDVQSQSILYIL